LYIFGGCGFHGDLQDLWRFSYASFRWEMVSTGGHVAGWFSGMPPGDDSVVSAGDWERGLTAAELPEAALTYRGQADWPLARHGATAHHGPDGFVWLFGGGFYLPDRLVADQAALASLQIDLTAGWEASGRLAMGTWTVLAPLVFLNDLWRFDLGHVSNPNQPPGSGYGGGPWTDVLRAELTRAGCDPKELPLHVTHSCQTVVPRFNFAGRRPSPESGQAADVAGAADMAWPSARAFGALLTTVEADGHQFGGRTLWLFGGVGTTGTLSDLWGVRHHSSSGGIFSGSWRAVVPTVRGLQPSLSRPTMLLPPGRHAGGAQQESQPVYLTDIGERCHFLDVCICHCHIRARTIS
jgi:hypothetical protein